MNAPFAVEADRHPRISTGGNVLIRHATIITVTNGTLPDNQPLIDYVTFSKACQDAATAAGHFDRASSLIDGAFRDWTDQTDGPALQTLAVLRAFDHLDAATKAVATELIRNNLTYLLGEYQNVTFNLWEEHQGLSFFARSVQLRSRSTAAPRRAASPGAGKTNRMPGSP